jgi:hypothetical protein
MEHAAAGEVLDERFLSPAFLPYVDAERLRALGPDAASRQREDGSAGEAVSRLRAWREVAHLWDWDAPEANRELLAVSAALSGHNLGGAGRGTRAWPAAG